MSDLIKALTAMLRVSKDDWKVEHCIVSEYPYTKMCGEDVPKYVYTNTFTNDIFYVEIDYNQAHVNGMYMDDSALLREALLGVKWAYYDRVQDERMKGLLEMIDNVKERMA